MFVRTLPPYLMLNGPEATGTSTPPAEPEQPSAPAPAAPEAPAAETPAAVPAAGDTPPWGDDFDPERAWRRIQKQKADLDAERAKREKAVKDAEAAAAQRAREETYREFGKQLGLVKEDETPTVDSLSATLQEERTALTSTQAALAAQRAENTVLRVAARPGINADADALLDSRGFTEKLAALDSSSAEYASQVEALVKAEVESNSRYRKVQVAPKSSNGDPAPIGGNQPKDDDIESLRAEYRKARGLSD